MIVVHKWNRVLPLLNLALQPSSPPTIQPVQTPDHSPFIQPIITLTPLPLSYVPQPSVPGLGFMSPVSVPAQPLPLTVAQGQQPLLVVASSVPSSPAPGSITSVSNSPLLTASSQPQTMTVLPPLPLATTVPTICVATVPTPTEQLGLASDSAAQVPLGRMPCQNNLKLSWPCYCVARNLQYILFILSVSHIHFDVLHTRMLLKLFCILLFHLME